jgi:predicted dehydrogenase
VTDPIRWGVLGPGNIARKFAAGLSVLDDAQLLAVGSRSQDSADKFGDEFHVERRYSSYETLVKDPDLDVIYIATPHPFHVQQSILCLEHGKAVLCEKPFTINAQEARQIVDTARAKRIFAMEAMWTRFIPMWVQIRKMLADGIIGEIRMITGDFGYRAPFDPQRRTLNPALGGGGLLDVGVYPISIVSMLLGTPDRIASMADIGETGVDEQAAAIMGYANGAMGIIHTAVRTQTLLETAIMGTDGHIRVHAPSWVPTKITLTRAGAEPEEIEVPFVGNGYNYQAAEVARCLREGKLESETMPLDESISIMETMDEIRAQWGMKYPME